MDDTHIRPLLQVDKPLLINLLKNTPEFSPADLAVAEELCNSYLRDSTASGYHIYVIEKGFRIAGYICYGPTPLTHGTWDIYWIAVDKGLRGQGLGKRMLEYAEDKIREARGRLMLIETSSREDYQKSRDFYGDMGYEVISQIPDFYQQGEDKLVLWKKLP